MKFSKKICVLLSCILTLPSVIVINTDAIGLGYKFDFASAQTEYTVPVGYDFTLNDIVEFGITTQAILYHDMPEDPLCGKITYDDNIYTSEIKNLELISSDDTVENYSLSIKRPVPYSGYFDLKIKAELIPDEKNSNKAQFVISFDEDNYMNEYYGLTLNITYSENDVSHNLGNINSDFNIDYKDVCIIKEYILLSNTSQQLQNADMNADRQIDIYDVIRLKNNILM